MNPPLLFISLVTAMLSSSAQITVDISNIATVGDTLFLAEDTVIGSSLDLGEAAGNQVWDFTSLTEHKPDGGILENPSTAPLSSNYPNATFVLNDLVEDSIHLFFERTTSALDIIGMIEYDSAGNPQEGDFTNTWRFMQFASTMGDSWESAMISDVFSDSINFDPDGPGPHPFVDSIRSTYELSFYNEIDAWGEMQLPNGDYLAIRQKVVNTIKSVGECYYDGAWNPLTPLLLSFPGIDSVTYDTAQEATYRWWSDNQKANIFIVEIETDSNGNGTNNVVFTTEEPAWITGLNSVENTSFSVYPNPSADFIMIETDIKTNWSLVMYDINAKVVLKKSLDSYDGRINTTNLPSGYYLLQALNANGETIKLKKVQILH